MLNIQRFTFNPLDEHCWLVWDGDGTAVAVDPGFFQPGEEDALTGAIAEGGLKLGAILLTHAHFDHIFGVRSLQDRYGVPVYMSPDEVPMLSWGRPMAAAFGLPGPDISFKSTPVLEGDTVTVGQMSLKVISTPGHSPGGLCWLEEGEQLLFCGDTLFAGTIGRTNLPLASYDDLIRSIMDKLMGLDGEVRILPGHGRSSTIAEERTTNPFLEPWGEPEEDQLFR